MLLGMIMERKEEVGKTKELQCENCIFCRHVSKTRDKPTILNTLTTVGVWNSKVLCPFAHIPISAYLSLLTSMCYPITDPPPSVIRISNILHFLWAHEWKEKQTDYTQYFDYSWSME